MDYNTKEEDILLWQAVRKGDQKAFGCFYAKYYTLLYSYCCLYVCSEDAEEVVDEIMIHFWNKREKIIPISSMRNLLLYATKNLCISLLRKKKGNILIVDYLLLAEEIGCEEIDSCVFEELQDVIRQGMDKLSEVQRKTFELLRLQDKKREEVAREMGVSIKTVDYRIRQVLIFLQGYLKEYIV